MKLKQVSDGFGHLWYLDADALYSWHWQWNDQQHKKAQTTPLDSGSEELKKKGRDEETRIFFIAPDAP